jgi:arylsulfatase A-like enzyme
MHWSGKISLALMTIATLFGVAGAAAAKAQQKKPNILIIWGDDIGEFNISAYNMGRMGYRTLNIDSIAKESAIFTDWYGQQSCTAGRAAFITGQSPIRAGMTKVGLAGAPAPNLTSSLVQTDSLALDSLAASGANPVPDPIGCC